MPPAYGTCQFMQQETESIDVATEWAPLIRRKAVTTYLWPKRYIFSTLAFTACCIAVSFNINLSIAIVSMIDPSQNEAFNGTNGNATNETDNQAFNETVLKIMGNAFNDTVKQSETNRLQWDGTMEGLALGAVYCGQLISFIPGGRMAELYGGKTMIIICIMLSSLATMLLPVAAMWGAWAFLVVRVVVGLGTGPVIPILLHMLSKWIPEYERSFQNSFILSGYGIGSFLAVIVSGALCGSTFLGGWPSVYYTGGLAGLLWCFCCAYLMYETPDDHPFMSGEEYLEIIQGRSYKKEKIVSIPWKKMVLSVPLWALAIGFFGQFWLLGFFSTVHALYMGTVLRLPTVQNGMLSCLPHLLRAFATCLASYPIDVILKRKIVSVGFVRKGATIINTLVSCGAFLGITFIGLDVTATTILFVLGGILGEFVTFGVCLAAIDIAPDLSGTVSGILNILGVFPFFIIPSLVGWMTNEENTYEQWKKVFYITILIVSTSTAIFVLFGDLNPQAWGTGAEKQNSKMEGRNEIVKKEKSFKLAQIKA